MWQFQCVMALDNVSEVDDWSPTLLAAMTKPSHASVHRSLAHCFSSVSQSTLLQSPPRDHYKRSTFESQHLFISSFLNNSKQPLFHHSILQCPTSRHLYRPTHRISSHHTSLHLFPSLRANRSLPPHPQHLHLSTSNVLQGPVPIPPLREARWCQPRLAQDLPHLFVCRLL